jgi:hypothetical protein
MENIVGGLSQEGTMITSNDELVRRIYRLRRLLASREAAIESTFEIMCDSGVTKEQVREICIAEDQRRANLMQTLDATMRELAK